MSEQSPKLADWERTLLEFIVADVKKALRQGQPIDFVLVVSPSTLAVLQKCARLAGMQVEGMTFRKIEIAADPDIKTEYAFQDLRDVARKIECPVTR